MGKNYREFRFEVKEIKDQIDKHANEVERLKSLLVNETLLAVQFSKGLKFLGEYVSDGNVATMIADYKDYIAQGYDIDEAKIATMWSAVKWRSIPSDKVEAAISKFMDYDPSRRAAYISFRKNHGVILVVGYLLWCALILITLHYWTSLFVADNFFSIFVPLVIILYYFMFSLSFLKDRNY